MGYLFLDQYLYEEAEQCFNDSYRCGEELNDTLDMLYAQKDLAMTYQWQNKYRECLEVLKKAETMALLTPYTRMKVLIAQEAASVANDLKDFNETRKEIQLPLPAGDNTALFIRLLDSVLRLGTYPRVGDGGRLCRHRRADSLFRV